MLLPLFSLSYQLPAGTYTTFYRCRLIAADGGWYGEILGNGSW